jgi:hypothetical protein
MASAAGVENVASSQAAATALSYLDHGFSIIPVGRDKRPLIAWKEYQTRRPTEAEAGAWSRQWPDAGVAIVCGAVSGLVVVDGDPRNGDGLARIEPFLPATVTVETGGGGKHFYFVQRQREHIAKCPALRPGLDLQAEASYVVAPPSWHPSGRQYRFVSGRALGEIPVAPLPAIIRFIVAGHRRPERRPNRRPTASNGSLTLDGALHRLDAVRRSGEGWLARCPAHPDAEPSLSLARGTDGRLLVHCFAGCTFGDVTAALRGGVRP